MKTNKKGRETVIEHRRRPETVGLVTGVFASNIRVIIDSLDPRKETIFDGPNIDIPEDLEDLEIYSIEIIYAGLRIIVFER